MFKDRNQHITHKYNSQQSIFGKGRTFIQPKIDVNRPEETVESEVTIDNTSSQKMNPISFLKTPIIQNKTEAEEKENQEWYEDTFSGNNHMPYEVQVIFNNIDKNSAYTVPEEEKEVFEEWKDILVQQIHALTSQGGKNAIINIFRLIVKAIGNGILPKKMIEVLTQKNKTFKSASEWNENDEKPCQVISETDLVTIFKDGDLLDQLKTNEQGRTCKEIENNQCLRSEEEYLSFLKDNKVADHLNNAFRILGIDTIKAQAVYLAHAAGESNNLMSLTETKNKWMANYRGGEKFRGRGAFHTTHRDGYVRVLAYLDALLENEKISEEDKKTINRASEAIKKDVTKASDPEFTFLFSAAYMHMAGGVAVSGNVKGNPSFQGKGPESSWVAGNDINKLKEKEKFLGRAALKAKVYARAISVLGNDKCSDKE
ncbi:hypothetical protein [uncultured Aquimarina sp.]|uniref:hypothetical protein n=1 Tax=uncultured Aquimarina sp. TaxID=575652 RepID=UPI002636B321|nr:hypothetical protein [uncultured Aquimarina sp.]